MIDTHCHLNFPQYNQDRGEVIKRAKSELKLVINVGTDEKTNQETIDLIDSYKFIYGAIGCHPQDVASRKINWSKIRKQLSNKKIIAIGEVGLDYYRIKNNQEKEIQKDIFKKFINLAKEYDLPLILHCRGEKNNSEQAYQEMLEVLVKEEGVKGVIHCFSSSKEIAKKFIDLGFYLGFTGIITFKNVNQELLETIKQTSIDRILPETDAPFLAPKPYRGQRNEPIYVRYVIEKIAELKNLNFKGIDQKLEKNVFDLFEV